MCSGNTKVVSKIVKSQFLELANLLTVNLQAVKQEPQMSIFPIHMSFVSYYLLLLYFFIVDFQKFLHNVSSLVKRKDNSVFEIPRFTYFFVYFPFSESCKG